MSYAKARLVIRPILEDYAHMARAALILYEATGGWNDRVR